MPENNNYPNAEEKHLARNSISVAEMCILALLGAVIYVQKLALSSIPNVHLCAVLIIVTTVIFGWRALYSVAVFILLDMAFAVSGPWIIGYWIVWPALVAVSMLLRKEKSPFIWALVAGAHGLLFDIPFAFINLFIGGQGLFFAYLFSGLIFDIIHCVSNYVITLLLFTPLCKVMRMGMNAIGLQKP